MIDKLWKYKGTVSLGGQGALKVKSCLSVQQPPSEKRDVFIDIFPDLLVAEAQDGSAGGGLLTDELSRDQLFKVLCHLCGFYLRDTCQRLEGRAVRHHGDQFQRIARLAVNGEDTLADDVAELRREA